MLDGDYLVAVNPPPPDVDYLQERQALFGSENESLGTRFDVSRAPDELVLALLSELRIPGVSLTR